MDEVVESAEFESWFGPASIVSAGLLFLWQVILGAAFGPLAYAFWLGELFWLVVSILALRKRQVWWVLAGAPLALIPVFLAGVLFAACLQGNCI